MFNTQATQFDRSVVAPCISIACVLCRSISEENTGNLFANSQQFGGIVAEKIHSLLLLYRERKRRKEEKQRLKKTDPTTSQQRNESEQRRDSVITLLSFE